MYVRFFKIYNFRALFVLSDKNVEGLYRGGSARNLSPLMYRQSRHLIQYSISDFDYIDSISTLRFIVKRDRFSYINIISPPVPPERLRVSDFGLTGMNTDENGVFIKSTKWEWFRSSRQLPLVIIKFNSDTFRFPCLCLPADPTKEKGRRANYLVL